MLETMKLILMLQTFQVGFTSIACKLEILLKLKNDLDEVIKNAQCLLNIEH